MGGSRFSPLRSSLRILAPLVGVFFLFSLFASPVHGIDVEAADVLADGVAERVSYLRELGVNAVRMVDVPADERWREACAEEGIRIFAADEAPAFAFRLSDPGEVRAVPSERLRAGDPTEEWVYTGRGRKRGILGPDGRPTPRAVDVRYVFSSRRAEIDAADREQKEQMLARIAAEPRGFSTGELKLSDNLEFSGPDFSLRFNVVSGLLESWCVKGRELLTGPIQFVCLQTPKEASEEVFGGDTQWETDGSCTLVVPYFFSPSGRRAECRYNISIQGFLRIDWKWLDGGVDWPAIVLSMPLFPQSVSWEGRGPLPSRCASFGQYELPYSEAARRIFVDDLPPCLHDVGVFTVQGGETGGWQVRARGATFDVALEATKLWIHPTGFPVEIHGL